MSIRAEFQTDVDDFMESLTAFATGSYLAESDRELWDAPFAPEPALTDTRTALETYLDQVSAIGSQDLDEERASTALVSAVEKLCVALNQVNNANERAVFEPEEVEELIPIIIGAAHHAGLNPELGDVSEEFRDF